nr:Transmembrane protein [Ipomoea batatas]
MSGVTLAVAPDEPKPPSLLRTQQKPLKKQQAVGIMGSLRVIELQLVAFILVFSASGLVPLLDLAYPALSSAYLLIISRLAFPSHSRCGPPELFQGGRLFRAYVVFGTTVGLFLPLAYVLGGFARGDEHAVRSATPHLFLLSFQILTENIISRWSLFSAPVRAFVPLLYTVRRVFVILDWMQDVWVNKSLPATADFKDVVWHWFGRGLAVANLLYFCVNLFGFLIPCYLPRAFERYFRERDEIVAKAGEDYRRSPATTLNNKQPQPQPHHHLHTDKAD